MQRNRPKLCVDGCALRYLKRRSAFATMCEYIFWIPALLSSILARSVHLELRIENKWYIYVGGLFVCVYTCGVVKSTCIKKIAYEC